jgi:hypothetical protein
LAEAAGKFNPDRSVLPIPDRTFGGTIDSACVSSPAPVRRKHRRKGWKDE